VRAEYLVDARPISKVQGLPFTATELETALENATGPGWTPAGDFVMGGRGS
jgi:hypothetical protein